MKWLASLSAGIFAVAMMGQAALAQTTLHFTWYSDGNEGDVIAAQIKDFEAKNPDIKVSLDVVPFKAINESLPVQLAANQGPDLARVVDLGGLARYYLDLRPYLKDAAYYDKNFGPFLDWMRQPGDTKSIPGYMTQLTITGGFINKTLFDQAGVKVPGNKATWDDWATAVKQVADKTKIPYPMAMDRSGHRFLAGAISEGAKLFDAKGDPAVVDDGFKAFAQRIVDWHKSGVMSKELWGSVSGAAYRGANDEFKNAQVAMYYSGSWQIGQFDQTIGTAFDWEAIPQPCGPAACTGMPGGAAVVAIKTTQHPKEVARLIDYLTDEKVLGDFYAKSLFVPGHLGLAQSGVNFATDKPGTKAALAAYSKMVGGISPVAYKAQGYVYNRIIFNAVITRLGQAVTGELSLDDADKRITDDITQQIAERKK